MRDRLAVTMRGAIVLLALALLANAAVLLLRGDEPPALNVFPQAQAQGGLQVPPDYMTLTNNYFLTVGGDGTRVYLWRYKPSGVEKDNTVVFIGTASARN